MPDYILSYNGELRHFGVKGMKWGVRRQEKMRQKAEKTLGRPVTMGDFGGGKITNRGIRKVKKYDELEKAYNRARKKGDPSFTYVHGLHMKTGTSLSDRKIKRIIRKMEKNPQLNVSDAVIRAHYISKGEKIAASILTTVTGTIVVSELKRRYSD